MAQGVPDTKNITPIGKLVAWDIAIGLTPEEAAIHLNLTKDEAVKIVRGHLVQKQIREFQDELQERLLEQQAGDPVRQFLHGKGMVFAETIVAEAQAEDTEEGTSTAASRLKAAELGLKYSGRTAVVENKAPQMIINITADKMKRAEDIREEVLNNVPDYVDGKFELSK